MIRGGEHFVHWLRFHHSFIVSATNHRTLSWSLSMVSWCRQLLWCSSSVICEGWGVCFLAMFPMNPLITCHMREHLYLLLIHTQDHSLCLYCFSLFEHYRWDVWFYWSVIINLFTGVTLLHPNRFLSISSFSNDYNLILKYGSYSQNCLYERVMLWLICYLSIFSHLNLVRFRLILFWHNQFLHMFSSFSSFSYFAWRNGDMAEYR